MNGSQTQPEAKTPVDERPRALPVQVESAGPNFDASGRWDPATKRMVVAILLVAGAILFWISRPVLPLLVIAWILSYILSPVVDTCERLHIPRSLSTIVLYLLFLVVLILVPILVTPILIRQLTDLFIDVPAVTLSFINYLQTTVANLPTTVEVLGFHFNIEGLVGQLQSSITGQEAVPILPSTAQILDYFNRLVATATNLVSNTALIGFSVVGGIFNVFLTLLFLFFLSLYMTKDAPRIREYVEGLFPQEYHSEAVDLMRELSHIWQSFLRGQLMLSGVIGVMTYAALSALQMPGALILAILAGLLEVLPNIGPILAMLPAVIVALIQGSDTLALSNVNFALLIVGVYFVIQQLENQILVPRIIGTSVNLHPIVVLCGVVVGASVGGILGALLAAPIIASLRLVGGYLYAKLLDYPPPLSRDKVRVQRARRPFVYRRVVRPEQQVPEKESEEASESPPAKSELGQSAVG